LRDSEVGIGEFAGLLVGVPTYNEALNAPRLVVELRRHLPGAILLVIDDSSPDGTADLVSAIAEADPLLRVLRRPKKLGLGTAYLATFAEAQRCGVGVVMTMDADFSHRPQDAPAVVRAVLRSDADLGIGSRYVPGGSIVGWPQGRRVLSAAANRLIRASLRTKVMDCTGSFRAYRMELAEHLMAQGLRNIGYSSLPELLMLAMADDACIIEVPIQFVERERGATKLTRRELLNSLINLLWLRRRRLELAGRRWPRRRSPARSDPSPPSPGSRNGPHRLAHEGQHNGAAEGIPRPIGRAYARDDERAYRR
jgi:glycosyltransferase involved in cell wall biosynthesis